jgi:hypothetical protein
VNDRRDLSESAGPAEITVDLSVPEMYLATLVGVMREIQHLGNPARQHRYGADPTRHFQLHIQGAAGELAVAKIYNCFWNGAVGNLRASDVGPLGVRTTAHPTGRLCLHPADPDDTPFVLVVGTMPTLRLAGWLRARDGKREEWWDDPQRTNRPAFYVPQHRLHPLTTLRHA